jgi:glycosyltransferase involved in cell wall biosynthesis
MAGKKKVLVFIDWYLPGFRAGGPIQSCANLIAHLSSDYDFYIITRDTDYCETIPYANVKSNTWNKLNESVHVYYLSNSKLSNAAIRQLCSDIDFDFVYLNGIYSFYFSILPLFILRKRKNIKRIVAARGMLAQSAIAVKSLKKSIFLRLAKLTNLYSNVCFQASSEEEAKDIRDALGNTTQVKIAANFPKKGIEFTFKDKPKEVGKLKLLNVARIAPEKNLKFALTALMTVKSEVIFDFYGPVYASNYFEECKQLIKKLPANIHTNYKGIIESEKVRELFLAHHVLLMPTLGENFGHIILESFSAGCPVVISDQTPWKNLKARNLGFELNLDQAQRFADAIDLLANMDSNEFNSWAKAASEFGKQYKDNPEILKQNLTLFSR